MDDPSTAKTEHAAWKALYRAGGAAILLAEVVFRRNWSAELLVSDGFGGIFNMPETPPATALEWFTLLQSDKFVGLSLLGLYDLINYALLGLLFLALYVALRAVRRSAMLVAITAGLIGVTIHLVSNPALDMFSLSQQYAAATSDARRATLSTAGETLLATHSPDGFYLGAGIYISLFLVLVAGLIISLVMLRSAIFSKWTAIMGLLANGIYLFYYPAMIFAPAIFWLPPTLAAPFRLVWHILIAIKLFKLGKS